MSPDVIEQPQTSQPSNNKVSEPLVRCEKLRELRQGKGWSRLDLIFEIYNKTHRRVHPNVIGALENGRKPAYSILRQDLAETLGLEESEIFPERLQIIKAKSTEPQAAQRL